MARQTHQFSQTKRAEIPRSSFDLSHGLKTTLDFGYLVPILSLEVLPGDTVNCRATLFGRLATPIKPVLDNMYLETFFFFTPYRQVWDNWVKFMGEQVNPGDSIDYQIPTLDSSGNPVTSLGLMDYMGVPIGINPAVQPVSALPFRCYNAIYNFWFRDENLAAAIPVQTNDGPDSSGNLSVHRRRKRRDYLTSALPWPQKGETVVVPLGDKAEVKTDSDEGEAVSVYSNPQDAYRLLFPDTVSDQVEVHADPGTEANSLYADLQLATSISINQLRESFQIQKLLERDARGGTRYPEILQSHFRVTDPQLLVHQRPIFLGGGSSNINVTPVAQTTDKINGGPGTETPQGNLAGFGTVSAKNHGFTASFTEHGHVIGIVNARADLTYQQGLERYFTRRTRYDFYFPVLSHLGEQAIFSREIYADGSAGDSEVFGYMPRYDEYRFKQSQITGLFRSAANDSLDVWHLAQDFGVRPTLNQGFIEDNPPVDRVIAVPSEPQLLLDVYFKIRAARPLPLYGTPGLIDHF